MKVYKKGEIAKIILKSLVLGGVVVSVIALPGMAPVLNLFGNDKRKSWKLNRTLKQCKKQKFVKIYYRNGEEFIEITKKGKERLLQYDYEDMKINIPKRWDGLWRIVIFDIPEKRRKLRNALVLKLKELGFVMIQKSIFVYPYKCKEEIDFVSEHLYIRKYINYILARNIEHEKKFKKLFNIS
jgi:phenylacetic acid degradation operon negative regulatory protein